MPIHVTADHTPVSTLVPTFAFDFLPAFALAVALMAVVWIACAVVTMFGVYLGGLVYIGARGLIRACAKRIRHHRSTEYAQLATVSSEGVTTEIINLDHYRRQREQRHRRPNTTEHTGDPSSGSNEPA
ncbi:hypothetical protein GCM10012275_59520 [Longimycelium tulufanense]|uniref:Uncharacterized protein n=1 Tax=Longimycelium tulufanense TaxID=907463 RepID=A0A8J3FXM7_9PSEU|nr:hypothetical protein [Longimycelium tulufanense]GGM80970.1 hypothetical protein GCM10012275_59520 [Longimycelium tulufanense]